MSVLYTRNRPCLNFRVYIHICVYRSVDIIFMIFICMISYVCVCTEQSRLISLCEFVFACVHMCMHQFLCNWHPNVRQKSLACTESVLYTYIHTYVLCCVCMHIQTSLLEVHTNLWECIQGFKFWNKSRYIHVTCFGTVSESKTTIIEAALSPKEASCMYPSLSSAHACASQLGGRENDPCRKLPHDRSTVAEQPQILGTANLIIIDVRYPLSTVFSTSLLLENRWNHDNGRQLLWEWQ